MTAYEAMRDFIGPLAAGWAVQLGKWRDGGPDHRAIVIRPAGGLSASLIREPLLTIMAIGGRHDTPTAVGAICETIAAAVRQSVPAGLVNCTMGEPSFFQTAEDRPAFEMAVSVILSY